MDQKQQQSSGFLNGLLLGLVLGAGLVLLLTTKKGKQVLRMLSEDGLDSITNLEELYVKLEKILADPADKVVTPQPVVEQPKVIAAPVVEPITEPIQSPEPQVTIPEVKEAAPVVVTPEPKVEPVAPAPAVHAAPAEPVVQVAPIVKEEPKVEVAPTQAPTPKVEVNDDVVEANNDYVPQKPRIIAVDRETSEKLAEMQARLDREIQAVSESIASNYVPYADDDMEEEEEAPKIKATRRRFFRGIPRRA